MMLRVSASLALSLPCICQTLVVGPGGGFTEIAAAVAAAPNGATILVRPGTYQGFQVVGKGLSILCDPGALVAGAVFVGGIAGNQAVTLRGLTSAAGWVPPSIPFGTLPPKLLEVAGCQGRVLIDTVDTTPAAQRVSVLGVLALWTPGFVGTACEQLVIRDSTFRADCSLTDCTTAIESTTFAGIYDYANGAFNTPGLRVQNGSVRIGGASSFQGAQGYYPGNVIEPILPASAGLDLIGDVRAQFVAGTAQSIMTSYPNDRGGIHVGFGLAGELRLAPRVVVNAVTGGAFPVVQVPRPTVAATMPAITSHGSLAVGALSATAVSEANDLMIVLVGLAGAPSLLPPFADAFWIDPAVYVFHAFGAPATGVLATSLPLPANPGLSGLALTWQAIASGPATGFAASNPSVIVVH